MSPSWKHQPNKFSASSNITHQDFLGVVLWYLAYIPLVLVPPERLQRPFVLSSAAFGATLIGLLAWAVPTAGGGGPLFKTVNTASSTPYSMMLGITSILGSWGSGTIGQSDWVSLFSRKRICIWISGWTNVVIGTILWKKILSNVISTFRCTIDDHPLCFGRSGGDLSVVIDLGRDHLVTYRIVKCYSRLLQFHSWRESRGILCWFGMYLRSIIDQRLVKLCKCESSYIVNMDQADVCDDVRYQLEWIWLDYGPSTWISDEVPIFSLLWVWFGCRGENDLQCTDG